MPPTLILSFICTNFEAFTTFCVTFTCIRRTKQDQKCFSFPKYPNFMLPCTVFRCPVPLMLRMHGIYSILRGAFFCICRHIWQKWLTPYCLGSVESGSFSGGNETAVYSRTITCYAWVSAKQPLCALAPFSFCCTVAPNPKTMASSSIFSHFRVI